MIGVGIACEGLDPIGHAKITGQMAAATAEVAGRMVAISRTRSHSALGVTALRNFKTFTARNGCLVCRNHCDCAEFSHDVMQEVQASGSLPRHQAIVCCRPVVKDVFGVHLKTS